VQILTEAWEYTPADRYFLVYMLILDGSIHVLGLYNLLLAPLYAGAVVDFLPKFSAREVWKRWIKSYPSDGNKGEKTITVFTGVPTMYIRLLQAYELMEIEAQKNAASTAHKLRLMMCGSSALPHHVMKQWERISGHRLLERYGMTEFGMVLSNPLHGHRKMGTVGKSLPSVQVKIISENSNNLYKPGIGELCVKSPSMFKEYWRQPQATKESFGDDGYFRTGDTAMLDEDGYFVILGRTSVDILKVGGYKLSALEIESTILEHPAIAECSVFGIPDTDYGEIVCAVVVPEDEAQRAAASSKPVITLQDLQKWAKERIARSLQGLNIHIKNQIWERNKGMALLDVITMKKWQFQVPITTLSARIILTIVNVEKMDDGKSHEEMPNTYEDNQRYEANSNLLFSTMPSQICRHVQMIEEADHRESLMCQSKSRQMGHHHDVKNEEKLELQGIDEARIPGDLVRRHASGIKASFNACVNSQLIGNFRTTMYGRERRGRRIQRSPSPPSRTLSTPPPARPFFQSARILRPIRMAQPNPYVNFTGSSPLTLNAQNPVPIAALKSIPHFTGENQTSPGDHVQDIANVCTIHEIHEMDIAVKLLTSSFKGKASQWFRSLEAGSIQNWNQLCTALHNQFGEKGDNLSLLEQLTTIKRALNEQLTDFNLIFQQTWDRIPTVVKPTNEGAFLYFLRALNSDISLMIQSMGGTTLPAAYNLSIGAENHLIQAGKITPRPSMPLYPELGGPDTSQAPTLAPIPTPRSQSSAEASTSSSNTSKEFQEVVMKQLQNFGNELALMVQTSMVPQEPGQEEDQQQGAQQGGPPNETMLVNWQAEDFCGMNQFPSQSVATNTRSKKRSIGEGRPLNSGDPQSSITPQGPGVPSATPNIQNQSKPPPKPSQAPVVTAHVQERNVSGKGQQKDNTFNIIE
ncbi:hypothetical protein KI387_008666, partial [Taxus chinensis]